VMRTDPAQFAVGEVVGGQRSGVECVQDSGRAKCVYATVADGGSRARTGTAIRLPEPDRVAVSSRRLAGGDLVAGDKLVVTALLLGVEEVAADREGRPARFRSAGAIARPAATSTSPSRSARRE
jgi:hypothetical protein